MGVIDEYLATVSGPEHEVLAHMYEVVRQELPQATEGLSYNMPAFLVGGKGVISILSNKKFISLYPFCKLERLDMEIVGFETTTGSIHFSPERPIPDDLLRAIIAARLRQLS